MTNIRRRLGDLVALIGRVLASFRPKPGTTEGAVMLGLILVAVGFIIADLPSLAFGVPGACLVMIGLGFSLRRSR